MQWVTSRKIRINRAATVWLIRRFIDPDAEFVFVAPGEVAAEAQRLGGIGFHAPGTAYPARDARGRIPFEALVADRCPDDAALRAHERDHPRRGCSQARCGPGGGGREADHRRFSARGLRRPRYGGAVTLSLRRHARRAAAAPRRPNADPGDAPAGAQAIRLALRGHVDFPTSTTDNSRGNKAVGCSPRMVLSLARALRSHVR